MGCHLGFLPCRRSKAGQRVLGLSEPIRILHQFTESSESPRSSGRAGSPLCPVSAFGCASGTIHEELQFLWGTENERLVGHVPKDLRDDAFKTASNCVKAWGFLADCGNDLTEDADGSRGALKPRGRSSYSATPYFVRTKQARVLLRPPSSLLSLLLPSSSLYSHGHRKGAWTEGRQLV